MAVYAGDEWEYAEGIHARVHHVPNPAASNAPEDLIYVYVTARLPGAMEPQYDVMSRATVDRYRAYSARPNQPPWTTHFEEMAKNACEKRLLKILPKSSRAPVEVQELERLDTMEEVADLGSSTLDTATGEIMGAPVAAEQPEPSPNGQQAAKAVADVLLPGVHRQDQEPAAGAKQIPPTPAEYDDSDDPF